MASLMFLLGCIALQLYLWKTIDRVYLFDASMAGGHVWFMRLVLGFIHLLLLLISIIFALLSAEHICKLVNYFLQKGENNGVTH